MHLCLRLKLTIGSSSLDLKLWPLLALGSNDLQPLDDGHHWSSIQANAPNFHRTGTLQLSQLELLWHHPNSSTSEWRSAVKILGMDSTMADPTKATKIPRFTKRQTAVWIFGMALSLQLPPIKNRGILLRGHCLINCWPLIHYDVQDMFVQVHWSLSLCKWFHFRLVIPIAVVFYHWWYSASLIHNTRLLILIGKKKMLIDWYSLVEYSLLFFTIGFWLTPKMTKNSLVPGPPPCGPHKKGDPFRRVTSFHWSLPGAPEAAVQKARDDFDSDRSRSKCILRLPFGYLT